MRVLVTGGAGYIGSHTAKALAAAGDAPVVFDNFQTGHRSAVRWGPLVEGDLGNAALIRDALHRHRIEAVLHFAASAYVGESMTDPRAYFRNNVVNTLNLLDAMVDSHVKHIVFSSSCTTYGTPDVVPITEQHPQHPVSPYGESKLFVERALHWYGAAYDLHWTALRYFNAAGADPDGELGEDHDPEPHLIPIVIQAALGTRHCVEIYGTDYPTPDGTAVRDYIHVSDLADAHVRALEYLVRGGASLPINLGTGYGHSVRDVIQAVQVASGRPVPQREAARRAGDPPMLVADVQRAAQVLGWQARHSAIESIVASAWSWHRDRQAAVT